MNAEIDEDDGGETEKHGEEIVFLENTFPGPVMVLMQAPKESVHDVLMSDIGNALHPKEASHEEQAVA